MDENCTKDITSPEDVKFMVDSFYKKVNNDELLSPVFNEFAGVDWETHLPKMYGFWNFLLLGITGYKGQPFPVHARLPVKKEHFQRWVELFNKNIDENFSGSNASIAKERAKNISLTFQYKLGLVK